jgi:hypothetical protein
MQLVARPWRERRSEQQLLHRLKHCRRRRRVARVAARRFVQRRFVAIEPRQAIAERADVRGQPGRPAVRGEDQVRRRVVADGNRSVAEVPEPHAPFGDVLFRDRRVVEQFALGVSDAAIEPLLAAVDAREHVGGGEQLERAAHRKPFGRAMLDARAGLRVEDRDAEPAARPLLQIAKPRVRQQRAGKEDGAEQNGPSIHRDHSAMRAVHRSGYALFRSIFLCSFTVSSASLSRSQMRSTAG